MKKTAFYDIHRRFNAKFVEFAGFEMPLFYEGRGYWRRHYGRGVRRAYLTFPIWVGS